MHLPYRPRLRMKAMYSTVVFALAMGFLILSTAIAIEGHSASKISALPFLLIAASLLNAGVYMVADDVKKNRT